MKLGSIKERECNDMIKNRIRLLPVLLLAVWVLAGCGHQVASADKASDGRLQVVTTLFPQYDFARQIGGDHADVSLVLLPGMESHMYDPTPGDMIRISEADMFIYTGAEMEPWAQELADSVDMSKVKVVDASSGVSMMKEEDEEQNMRRRRKIQPMRRKTVMTTAAITMSIRMIRISGWICRMPYRW